MIDQLQRRFVEVMGNFAKEVGIVGASEGRILGYLILSDKPLSQDDLMEISGGSRGHVSTALKTLIVGHFAKKTTIKGSRKEYYEANQDLWRVTIGFVIRRIGQQIDIIHAEFTDILKETALIKNSNHSASEKRSALQLQKRVEKLSLYTKSANTLLSTVEKLVTRGK